MSIKLAHGIVVSLFIVNVMLATKISNLPLSLLMASAAIGLTARHFLINPRFIPDDEKE